MPERIWGLVDEVGVGEGVKGAGGDEVSSGTTVHGGVERRVCP